MIWLDESMLFNMPQVKAMSWHVAGDRMWRKATSYFQGAVSRKLENALEMHANINLR